MLHVTLGHSLNSTVAAPYFKSNFHIHIPRHTGNKPSKEWKILLSRAYYSVNIIIRSFISASSKNEWPVIWDLPSWRLKTSSFSDFTLQECFILVRLSRMNQWCNFTKSHAYLHSSTWSPFVINIHQHQIIFSTPVLCWCASLGISLMFFGYGMT